MNLSAILSKRSFHNFASSRPQKTEKLMLFFLFVVIACMTIAMIIITQSLTKDLTGHFKAPFEQKALNIINKIDHYLEGHTTQILASVSQPIILESLNRWTKKTDNIQLNNFLIEQKINNIYYSQRIYNSQGKILASTIEEDAFNKKDLPSTTNLLDKYIHESSEQNTSSIQLNSDQTGWVINTPIVFNKELKGFITTYIPLIEIETKLDLINLKGIQVGIQSTNAESKIWGSSVASRLKSKESNYSDIQYTYGIDLTALSKFLSSATLQIIASSLVLALISTGLAIMLVRWLFVLPLKELQELAADVSKDSNSKLSARKHITIEIQDLSDTITNMAKEIYERKQAFMESSRALQKNQNTLINTEKMASLGQVTAGVAHEINNSVGFIINNLSTLREYHQFIKALIEQLLCLMNELTAEEKTAHHKIIKDIQSTLKKERLDFVINDLDHLTDESLKGTENIKDITFGLKGYAHAGEQKTLLDLNECVESTLKVVWSELKYNCTVVKDLQPIPLVECIGGQINQVLMNLFINASHAMAGKKGELRIQTFSVKDNVFIIISDNGCGIKRDNLKLIFEPFYTTKPVGQGTGLGMSISFDIIKQHCGQIQVESEVGFGTSFMISLPTAKKEAI